MFNSRGAFIRQLILNTSVECRFVGENLDAGEGFGKTPDESASKPAQPRSALRCGASRQEKAANLFSIWIILSHYVIYCNVGGMVKWMPFLTWIMPGEHSLATIRAHDPSEPRTDSFESSPFVLEK